jgi:hypothetical protein
MDNITNTDQPNPPAPAAPARRPWAIKVSVVVSALLGVAGLFAAFDHIMVAVDWEHRYLARYLQEFGPAHASPVYQYLLAGVDIVIAVLLLWGANRAANGITNKILILGLSAFAADILSNLFLGRDVVWVLISLTLPILMIALLVMRSSREFFRARAR